MKPLSPKQVIEAKRKSIPDFVYEAFNELLIKHFRNERAVISQEEAIHRIMEYSGTEIFDDRWLDIEGEYQKNGWEVTYDSEQNNFVFKAIK